jgi:spore maturation protein B
VIPIIIFAIILYGLKEKVDVFTVFIQGALEGMKIALSIAPTLVGLFIAVGIAKDSGTLDIITKILMPAAKLIHTPAPVLPVIITKLFSSGSAASLMINIFEEYGPDSLEGFTASLILSSTESVFYTMSVFLMAAKITKSRYTLPGALLCVLSGVIASIILANLLIS